MTGPLNELLELFKSCAFETRWTVTDGNGNPVNLDGPTVKFRIWASQTASSPLVDANTSNGGIIADGNGNIDLFLSTTVMNIAPTEDVPYLWNLIATLGGQDYILADGPCLVHGKARIGGA